MAGRLRIPVGPRDEARMTLIEHLEEFRSRLFRVAIAFVLTCIGTWIFRRQIFDWLIEPADIEKLTYMGPAQALMTDVKLSLFSAFLITVPVVIYQIWMFVAPAVGDVGRAFTYVIVTLSSLLFLAGVAFGYYAVLPVGLEFLLNYEEDRFEALPTADTYLPFITRTLLAAGIVFELPAATYVGAKLGLVTSSVLKRFRKHALIFNAVLAAALTPSPDPFSMILMAVPLTVMYELSIIIARFVNPMVPHDEAMENSPLSDGIPEDDEDGDDLRDADLDDRTEARRNDEPAPERDL